MHSDFCCVLCSCCLNFRVQASSATACTGTRRHARGTTFASVQSVDACGMQCGNESGKRTLGTLAEVSFRVKRCTFNSIFHPDLSAELPLHRMESQL